MMPHGWCLLWNNNLIWTDVISDSMIALSYFTIPLMLFYIRARIIESLGRNIFLLFALFILACGATHVMDILVFWFPIYWVQAGIKVPTAIVSIFTAMFLRRSIRNFA